MQQTHLYFFAIIWKGTPRLSWITEKEELIEMDTIVIESGPIRLPDGFFIKTVTGSQVDEKTFQSSPSCPGRENKPAWATHFGPIELLSWVNNGI